MVRDNDGTLCIVFILWAFTTVMDEAEGQCCDVLLGEGRPHSE